MVSDQMRYTDIIKLYCISDTAFYKAVHMGIFKRVEKEYTTPWGHVQLFKPKDVAAFLSRFSGSYWTSRQVLYSFGSLFFDIHCDMCSRSMPRITIHDFKSLIESHDSELSPVFEKHFRFALGEPTLD